MVLEAFKKAIDNVFKGKLSKKKADLIYGVPRRTRQTNEMAKNPCDWIVRQRF